MKARPWRLATSVAIGGGVLALLLSGSAQPARAAALPACSTTQLAPLLGATMVNQGVASYADPGAKLVRGKDTLVRFFLVNQPGVGATCSGTTSVRSASMNVTNAAGVVYPISAPLQSFGTSGSAIPSSTVAVDSNADPKFVLPADHVNNCLAAGCTDTSGFSLSFAVTVTYSVNGSTSTANISFPAVSAAFDQATNALRILAIPMGDKSQLYSSQFSDAARVAVQNAFAALSRIYPVPTGVSSTLASTTGGIRYKLDLSAMLNLKSISGAYDSNGKFCGTQANFDGGIKSQLSGFLTTYNSSITDPNQRADKVVGVVDQNISDGSTSTFNCAEAMASTVSPESWVRAIPDQAASGKNPPVPSMTGALLAMEMAHTFGLDTTLSFHSPNTQADLTAPDKAYNLSSRGYLSDDRSTMRFVSTNPFNNNNALLEKDDYGHMLCNLGGSLSGNCTSASVGTAVAAGPTFAIFGTTDLTPGGTHVLESYKSDNDPILTGTTGDLTLQFFDSAGVHMNADVAVPYSTKTSEHDSNTNVNTTTAVFGGIFDAPAGYTAVRLVYNGTTLYERSSAPLTSEGAGEGRFAPGGTITEQKTLTTPVIPPKPDVIFLSDTTGSMDGPIANVKSNICCDPTSSILQKVLSVQHDAQFGVADYKDFAADCPYAYKLGQAITSDTTAIANAVGAWQAGCGLDIPEADFWGLHELATESNVGWRTGSSKIIVWIGDAPSHDPTGPDGGPSVTQASVINDLTTAGIRVIAINVGALDASGQASAIVNATGGVLQTTSDPNTVSPAILTGLHNLPATVTPQATCDSGLSVAFDPTSSTVDSGKDVSFTEKISISNAATVGSTLNCTIVFPVNGVVPDDPAFTQKVAIKVTGGTGIVGTFQADDPTKVRAHLIYDCGNGEKEPAFVGLDGTEVASNIVQFQQNVDPSLSCANATGSATLTIVATNGVDAVPATIAASPTSFPVADKAPSAAIYQPTLDAVIPYTSQFSLNGHVADPEDGNLTPHWTITSGPVTPAISDTTDTVDIPPPAGGWPAGDYVIQLSGTDSHGHTSTATTRVHVAHYTFAGFFQPVDNPPTLNTGKGGNTYPIKWSLTQNGTTISDLNAVVALRFAATGCGTEPTDALETTATGGTGLRYDTTAQQYIYNWKTPSTPGCYVLTLTLADGSTWPAYFQLK